MAEEWKIIDYTSGKPVQIDTFIIDDPDLLKMLDDARKEWKALEEAGTPYWCNCKPQPDMLAEMDAGRAYWQEDQWDNPEWDGIHGKHGIMHRPCGGYLQEG